MVAYSLLMRADEREPVARPKTHCAELIDPKIVEHHGRIVKTAGENLLVEFAGVVDAAAEQTGLGDKMDAPGNKALDALAERVLDARAEFDARLHGRGRRFPVEEFDRLWLAVLEYAAQMRSRKWLHRDVAREFSGFREYLQLEIFDTPGDALRRADRMEIVLFF